MKVAFVAEVSSNHNRNINRCLKFIETASEIGCSAVKFQLFKIHELFAPEILEKSEKHRMRKEWELPTEFLPELASLCQEKEIQFACTPFYLDAVDELLPFVDYFKIASYELLWTDLLKACAQTGKPVVLSTGMTTLKEVQRAVEVLCGFGCVDLTLLHCVSAYPAPVEECNLAAIEIIRKTMGNLKLEINAKVGWSDHSINPSVIFRAVHRWDCSMVEFHLDLDEKGDEFESGHCWLPNQIKPVIESVRMGFSADGRSDKIPVPTELPDRAWRADPVDGLRPMLKARMTQGR
jgi:N-acetylneuraminate synthase